MQRVAHTTEAGVTQADVMEKEPVTAITVGPATEASVRSSNKRISSSSGSKSSNKNRKRTKNRTKNQNTGNKSKNKVIKNTSINKKYQLNPLYFFTLNKKIKNIKIEKRETDYLYSTQE